MVFWDFRFTIFRLLSFISWRMLGVIDEKMVILG